MIWKALIVLTMLGFIAGCLDSPSQDLPLDGTWTVTDSLYREAGKTSIATGTLFLSQTGTMITGHISWSDSTIVFDSLRGSVVNTSMNFEVYDSKDPSDSLMFAGKAYGDTSFQAHWTTLVPGSSQSWNAKKRPVLY